MVGYCKSGSCLRGYILDYFGQPHSHRCGNCGNCGGDFEWKDITTEAQMVLSCIWRIRKRLDYSVGAGTVIGVLRGSKQARLLKLHLDELSTYGLLQKLSVQEVRAYIDTLEAQDFLRTETTHLTLELTEAANEVLFHDRKVKMKVKREAIKPVVQTQTYAGLLDRLRAVRTRLARKLNVPSYMIFSNATLEDMARKRPKTLDEFLQVNGVGSMKANKYGEDFLREIVDEGEAN